MKNKQFRNMTKICLFPFCWAHANIYTLYMYMYVPYSGKHLCDSHSKTAYFSSLAFQDYVPSLTDILHSRKATKAFQEHVIDIRNVPFRFVDVGGQRSQRQKWFQCFESVTSILFLASSSEFDQVLMEDRITNRLLESCNIFDTIVNHKCFANISIILFLNKTDLLEEKIKHVSIKDYFPNFQGDPHSMNDVQNFILKMFDVRRRERGSKALFHYFTTAVDTNNIRYVFQAVRDTILQENLKRLMLQWCKLSFLFLVPSPVNTPLC